MFGKIKVSPHKIIFAIGMALVLIGSSLPINLLAKFISVVVMVIGFIFIIILYNRKHS